MTTTSRFTKALLVYLVIFAAVGLWDSFSIHLKEIASATDQNVFKTCNLSSILDCGAVARSKASHFLGVPVSLFGILYYEAFLVGGLALLFGFPLRRWLIWIVSIVAALAFFFSWRLFYISWYGLGVLCPYCLTSNLATTVITISWFLYVLTKRKLYSPTA